MNVKDGDFCAGEELEERSGERLSRSTLVESSVLCTCSVSRCAPVPRDCAGFSFLFAAGRG